MLASFSVRTLAVLFLAVTSLSLPGLSEAQGNQSEQCLIDGSILSISPECLNDVAALVVDSTKRDSSGWQYAYDSQTDGSGGSADNFNIKGLGLRVTSNELWFVINGNLPVTGFPYGDLNIGWGDLFIDNSGQATFQGASGIGKLLAVHFLDALISSDSGASQKGLYSNVTAKSVTGINAGYATLQEYEDSVLAGDPTNFPDMADLPYSQTYYIKSSSLNSLLSGTYLGTITDLTEPDLLGGGFNPGPGFNGLYTIAFKISKNLICDVCGVYGGDGTSCLDCNGVPNGGAVYDECQVCGGDNSSCADCNGVPNGGNTSCIDCEGVRNGGKVIDQCNVCGGNGTSCTDCKGVPFGTSKVDQCNVCGGDGTSCISCTGKDNVPDQFVLDGVALRLRNNAINAVRLFKTYGLDNSANRSTLASIRRKANAYYLEAWKLAWTLPGITYTYKGPGSASSTSNSASLNSYNDRIRDLSNLTTQAISRLRKQSKKRRAGQGLLNRAAKLTVTATTTAASFPTKSDDCSSAGGGNNNS